GDQPEVVAVGGEARQVVEPRPDNDGEWQDHGSGRVGPRPKLPENHNYEQDVDDEVLGAHSRNVEPPRWRWTAVATAASPKGGKVVSAYRRGHLGTGRAT